MFVKNPKQLAKLMAIEDVSARSLARVAGWRSHSYMNRLLAGRVFTVRPDAAARIAEHLGVKVADLFTDEPPEAVPAQSRLRSRARAAR